MRLPLSTLTVCLFLLLGCNSFSMSAEKYFEDQYHDFARAILREDVAYLAQHVSELDINHLGADQMTLLNLAFLNNRKRSFKWLLDHKADPNQIILDETGNTYLIVEAMISNDIDYFNWLLPIADLGVKDHKGYPILHLALMTGHRERMYPLLDHGADINSIDAHHRTALFLLCNLNNYEEALKLFRRGADPDIRSDTGLNIVDKIKGNSLPQNIPTYQWQQQLLAAILERK